MYIICTHISQLFPLQEPTINGTPATRAQPAPRSSLLNTILQAKELRLLREQAGPRTSVPMNLEHLIKGSAQKLQGSYYKDTEINLKGFPLARSGTMSASK